VSTTPVGYRIQRLLARGGMGEVYLAEEIELGRTVALKLLPRELGSDARFRERFLRESRLAAALNHPHIVPVYRAGEADGVLFIAMHYVEGTDLRRLLSEHDDGLDAARAASIVEQVADALDAAHGRGLVHRDVKPANILISPGRRHDHCYLADFGLTRHASSQSRLTATGEFMGTVDYVAPEQIRGTDPIDHRVDVYSLGCVLFECITGTPPFRGESDYSVMWAHVHDPPPPISERRRGLPAEVEPVIARALAKSPDDRYPAAGEFASALLGALGETRRGMPTLVPASGRARRLSGRIRRTGGRRLAAALAAAGAIAGIAIAAILLYPSGDNSKPTPSYGAELRGDLSKVTLGPRLSLRAWLNENEQAVEDRSGTELGTLGQVVHFRFAVRGLAGARFPVLWSVRKASDSRLVRGFIGQRGAIVKPLARRYTAEGEIWASIPGGKGPFLIELQLVYRGRELASRNTPSFPGLPRSVSPPSPPSPPPPAAPPPPPPVTTIIG